MIMWTRRMLLVLSVIIGVAAPAMARKSGPYLAPDAVPLLDLLAPPPAQDSATTKAELEGIVVAMASASQARKTLAIADNEESLAQFLADTSIKIDTEKLPLTLALVRRVTATVGEFVAAAKKGFGRPRPPFADSRIKPLIGIWNSGAYPSGHTAFGAALAIVLAKLLPEKRGELMIRAKEYAWSRVIVGVHYPSDLDAGYTAGAVIAQAMMQTADFREDVEPAKAELRKALGL